MNLKSRRNICHLAQFVLAVVAAAMLAGLTCIRCGEFTFINQLVDATIYGYLATASIVFLAMCFEEEIPEKMQYAICGTGFILYLVATILLFLEPFGTDLGGIRVLVGSVAAAGNAAAYGVEFIWSLIKKGNMD